MRDRLIELLMNTPKPPIIIGGRANGRTYQTAGNIADHLLANGVIVPPCKVGQKVYCIVNEVFDTPLEAFIYSITIQAEGIIMRCGVKGYYGVSYMATDFGKKFFLTREEAEQKLREGDGE